jgi:hypothetical protein
VLIPIPSGSAPSPGTHRRLCSAHRAAGGKKRSRLQAASDSDDELAEAPIEEHGGAAAAEEVGADGAPGGDGAEVGALLIPARPYTSTNKRCRLGVRNACWVRARAFRVAAVGSLLDSGAVGGSVGAVLGCLQGVCRPGAAQHAR